MPSLKYRSAQTEPLAPLNYGFHKSSERMDCWFKNNALERTIEMPIELLAQSAALFCPYRFCKFNGASGSVRAERYFREGMLALPYRWLSLI